MTVDMPHKRRQLPSAMTLLLLLLLLLIGEQQYMPHAFTPIRPKNGGHCRSSFAIRNMADFWANNDNDNGAGASNQHHHQQQGLFFAEKNQEWPSSYNIHFNNNTAALALRPNLVEATTTTTSTTTTSHDAVLSPSSSYWAPRLLLGLIACIYGTNFPLGSLLDHALPASAVCSLRFGLAALVLLPFAARLPRHQWRTAVLAGGCTATGYITQALALQGDTSPATVSFLGATLVVWCPLLEYWGDGRPSAWTDRPQTYLAVTTCLLGVAILEFGGASGIGLSGAGGAISPETAVETSQSWGGHALAIVQAIGFGTGVYLSEKLMHQQQDDSDSDWAATSEDSSSSPNNALPITAVLVATTAVVSMVWWLVTEGAAVVLSSSSHADPALWWNDLMNDYTTTTLSDSTGLPLGLLLLGAILWTGLISTSLNFALEIWSLGRVPSGEASVLLASEPLWAALFGALLLGEHFAWNDTAGGALIVAACCVNSLSPSDIWQGLEQLGVGPQQQCEGQRE